MFDEVQSFHKRVTTRASQDQRASPFRPSRLSSFSKPFVFRQLRQLPQGICFYLLCIGVCLLGSCHVGLNWAQHADTEEWAKEVWQIRHYHLPRTFQHGHHRCWCYCCCIHALLLPVAALAASAVAGAMYHSMLLHGCRLLHSN
jgi:hypothetical protein